MAVKSARYGKANVRLLKVWRDPKNPKHQEIIELRIRTLLEGDLDKSYTDADNSCIVPTDTVKQTMYILAKQGAAWPVELFAARVAEHFPSRYPHITGVFVDIQQSCWTRYDVNGKPSLHSFVLNQNELRTVSVHKQVGKPYKLSSGIKNLTVLKSTGSEFHGFIDCEYTVLAPTWDRFLSTDVECVWNWDPKAVSDFAAVEQLAKAGAFDDAYSAARNITLETFALQNSASVQATMHDMGELLLAKFPKIETVFYGLPNKHYMEIDLSWFKGLKNTGKDAEVYLPSTDPNGYIECTVARSGSKL